MAVKSETPKAETETKEPWIEPEIAELEAPEADLGIHIKSLDGTVLGCQYATYEDAENAAHGVFAEIEVEIVE